MSGICNLKLLYMKRFLPLFSILSLSVLSGAAQQTIVMYHESPIRGTVLWDQTTSERVFFTHEQGLSDTLVQFVPRREVEYIVDCDSSKYVYKGVRKGWQQWEGRTFTSAPQHAMMYGLSGGIISKGWLVDASAMRYLHRSNFLGIGGFLRYASTSPFKTRNEHWGYTYTNQAFSLGVQFEFRGYMRKLKSFYYIQIGGGCTYHRFVDCKPEYFMDVNFTEETWENAFPFMNFPSSKWAPAVHGRAGFYTRLTRSLYADLSVGCFVRYYSETTSEKVSVFHLADQYPFGVSLGLRFGRED